MQDRGGAFYLECMWTGDKTQRLQRGRLDRRGVWSGAQKSMSRLMGEGTTRKVLKNGVEVRSLTESVSESDQNFMFEP